MLIHTLMHILMHMYALVEEAQVFYFQNRQNEKDTGNNETAARYTYIYIHSYIHIYLYIYTLTYI